MAKLHVTIRFDESDDYFEFVAAKPGPQGKDYPLRVKKALEGVPNIGIPLVDVNHDSEPGVTIFLDDIRGARQLNAKVEIQIALSKKAGYKTFVNIPN